MTPGTQEDRTVPALQALPGGSPGPHTPPHDAHAEVAVLGSMLLSRAAIEDSIEHLTGQDFYRPVHETIYDAILALYSRGEPADAITVADELAKRGELKRAGGQTYLHQLAASVPVAANAGWYARIVAERAVLRRVIAAGTRIVQLGHGPGEVRDIVTAAQAAVTDIETRAVRADPRPARDFLQETWDEMEQAGEGTPGGIQTGFRDLDATLGGFQAGQMIVIAARPGAGKSTLALDIARDAAIRQHAPTVFFSLEMQAKEIAARIIAAEASIQLQRIRSGDRRDVDFGRIAEVVTRVDAAPLLIDDSPVLTLTDIRAKSHRLRQSRDLRLVIVDYLQLMTTGRRAETRQQEVSEMSRGMKLLAKELGVPVVVLSQLNRNSEARQDKRPHLSDLRESGAIEQDADVVLLLHREDMYDRDSPRAGEADIIVAKHRNGPTPTIPVAFQGHYSRFTDMPGNDYL